MTSGFSVVDFINLPLVERRIMRSMLREVTMTYPQLRDAISTLPADQRPDDTKLSATLDQLTRDHWLVRQGNGQQSAYRMSKMRRSSSHNPGVWEKLEVESMTRPYSLQFQPPTERCSHSTTSGGKRTLPTSIWDCIIDDVPRKKQ